MAWSGSSAACAALASAPNVSPAAARRGFPAGCMLGAKDRRDKGYPKMTGRSTRRQAADSQSPGPRRATTSDLIHQRTRLRFSDRLSDIGHPKTVLIAEDDPTALAFFRRVLTPCGLKVLTANSGMSACATIREHHPDIILIDVQLSDISGLEIASWIKKEKTLESIAVVVVSMDPIKSDQDQVYLDRCDAHLLQPVSLDALLGTIWDLLDRPPECGRIDTPKQMQRPAS